MIRRYSLLGIGSAIGALFELLNQLEEAFYLIDLDKLIFDDYKDSTIPKEPGYLSLNPFNHLNNNWTSDETVKSIKKRYSLGTYEKVELNNDFFSRFAFFSARLGFREYDFSATAAIQVLVSGTSLKWNVINYSHEIIHNHVRVLLNSIISPNNSHNIGFRESVKKSFDILKSLLLEKEAINSLTYLEHFKCVILLYCINSKYSGSLSIPWNSAQYIKNSADIMTSSHEIPWALPTLEEITFRLIDSIKDISEIFVHVMDFHYVYAQKLVVYLDSIWNSWATVSAVISNISHYILRSLLVIGINEEGPVEDRFDRCIKVFRKFIKNTIDRDPDIQIFIKLHNYLQTQENEDDLKYRFQNCIQLADLASNFFIINLEGFLDREDQNVIPGLSKTSVSDPKSQETLYYNIEFGTFEPKLIISKLRFLLNELYRSVQHYDPDNSDYIERDAAWLLVTLSTQT